VSEGWITALLLVIGVVSHEKIPFDCRILGGKGVKNRDMIVIGQAGRRELQRVTSGFQEQYCVACCSQVRGHGPTASS